MPLAAVAMATELELVDEGAVEVEEDVEFAITLADEDEEVVEVVDVVARSKVVESTANSVGEPTRSKVIDEALDAGPEPFELAVELTEVANKFTAVV